MRTTCCRWANKNVETGRAQQLGYALYAVHFRLLDNRARSLTGYTRRTQFSFATRNASYYTHKAHNTWLQFRMLMSTVRTIHCTLQISSSRRYSALLYRNIAVIWRINFIVSPDWQSRIAELRYDDLMTLIFWFGVKSRITRRNLQAYAKFELILRDVKVLGLGLEANLQRPRYRSRSRVFVLGLAQLETESESAAEAWPHAKDRQHAKTSLFGHYKCTASAESTWTTTERVLRQ